MHCGSGLLDICVPMMLDTSDGLDPAQYYNRKGCSTIHYLVLLIHFLLSEAEVERYADLPAIDYSNAFDKINITFAKKHLSAPGPPC